MLTGISTHALFHSGVGVETEIKRIVNKRQNWNEPQQNDCGTSATSLLNPVYHLMSGRRYYLGAEQRARLNTSGDDDKSCHDDEPLYSYDGNNNNSNNTVSNVNDPEPDADKDDDSELQDVPYSSSSIDRSSIGSIPWADDAIKKNKLDWERVDRVLSGEEMLPEQQEVELRHEIADWQRKFPSLLARKAKPLKQHSFDNSRHNIALLPDDAGDIDSISDLSLSSLDEYDEKNGHGVVDEDGDDDGLLTPTVERQQASSSTTRNRTYVRPDQQNLVSMLDRDLRITSVALNLRKRREHFEHQQPATQASTMPQSATVSRFRSRIRMPPILNVLDSNRHFRGLLKNQSFVQLTQVQVQKQLQPKSAAWTYASNAGRRQQSGVRSAWNMPMAASRFLNNKHSIVLPSLNRQRDFTPTATSSQSIASSNNSSLLGSSLYATEHNIQHPHLHHLGKTLVTTSANTPSTGRSISAAIHHPRSEFSTSSVFYIPYSASKFKTFK
ncbi:uncharacterized protein LOC133835560 isoform X1 [Drosophila sulfurigaster albostrigata]|uniref:uncharacterized protein LOC133835560 isoform X1 n=2 Tax=Drosophila sulfurigaster albostrigata TaxID=89887 RepID=UPI002D21C21E|nr:uncharacterized protein LOC133835560 isoform X1 [Drosophila sulfurigaster albostrigata]